MTMLAVFNQPVGTFDTYLIPYGIEQACKATEQQLADQNRLVVIG